MTSAKVLPATEFERLRGAYDPSKNASPPFMTKYEKTLIKGLRLEQLHQGAPSVLGPEVAAKLSGHEAILEEEIARGLVPYIVLRTLPGGAKELWKFADLSLAYSS